MLAVAVGCGKASEPMADGAKVVTEKPVEKASVKEGWKELTAGGLTLTLPKDWRAIDLTTGDIKQALATAGLDQSMWGQVEQLAKNGAFKVFAAAPKPVDGFVDNVNVIELPTNQPLDVVLEENAKQMRAMGMKVGKTELLKDPDRGIIRSTQSMGGKPYHTYTALFVHKDRYYTVTFSSSSKTKAATEAIAAEACASAKF